MRRRGPSGACFSHATGFEYFVTAINWVLFWAQGMGHGPFNEYFGKILPPTQAPDQDPSTETMGPQQRHDLLRPARYRFIFIKKITQLIKPAHPCLKRDKTQGPGTIVVSPLATLVCKLCAVGDTGLKTGPVRCRHGAGGGRGEGVTVI